MKENSTKSAFCWRLVHFLRSEVLFAYLSDCISLACNLTLGRPKYRRRYNPKAQLESWTRLFRYCRNCLWAFDAVSRVGHGGLHNEDGRKEEEKKGAGREERIKNKWPVCDLTLFIAVVFIKLAKIFPFLLIQMVWVTLAYYSASIISEQNGKRKIGDLVPNREYFF